MQKKQTNKQKEKSLTTTTTTARNRQKSTKYSPHFCLCVGRSVAAAIVLEDWGIVTFIYSDYFSKEYRANHLRHYESC